MSVNPSNTGWNRAELGFHFTAKAWRLLTSTLWLGEVTESKADVSAGLGVDAEPLNWPMHLNMATTI